MKSRLLTALDRVLISTMKRFNKDLEWLKLNHPESYKRIKGCPQVDL